VSCEQTFEFCIQGQSYLRYRAELNAPQHRKWQLRFLESLISNAIRPADNPFRVVLIRGEIKRQERLERRETLKCNGNPSESEERTRKIHLCPRKVLAHNGRLLDRNSSLITFLSVALRDALVDPENAKRDPRVTSFSLSLSLLRDGTFAAKKLAIESDTRSDDGSTVD